MHLHPQKDGKTIYYAHPLYKLHKSKLKCYHNHDYVSYETCEPSPLPFNYSHLTFPTASRKLLFPIPPIFNTEKNKQTEAVGAP